MIQIAILGHGVVGSGVAELMEKNVTAIAHKAGQEIAVRRILDLRDFPDCPYAYKFTKDFDQILQDPEIRIVVETMGGLHPAYEFTRLCLENGKSVVTSNKELVAAKGDELLALAKQNNLNYLFEASVGGGIPILRPLDQCLAANEVVEVAGILNGTTNFMLTKMFTEGMTFDAALALAQKLGYAEKNPTADVDGHDACRKICILAALAFGRHVYPEWVHTEGIRGIDAQDVRAAETWGGVIKLIGRAVRREDGKLYIIVAPMLIPGNALISAVKDVFNAVLVRGNAVGDVMFYGRGAGKMPTASAVVADVIDEVKHIKARKYLCWDKADPDMILPYEEQTVRLYLRVKGDAMTALQQLERRFGPVERIPAGDDQTLTVILPPLPEKECDRRLADFTAGTVASRLRVVAFG
ncbi:MAG: homoserine dehydrogenase [Clostridia bacterium]|nr:homoserine dehydrogenase [Clostridia bacterium]